MSRTRAATRCLAAAAFAALLLLYMHAGYGSLFDHDEHQFIAPAYHILDGCVPYRDFPLFHVPYQHYLFAAIVSVSDEPMAALRRVGPWCAWLTVLVIVLSLRRQLQGNLPLATAIAALFAFHWTLPYTVGRTWNHATSALAAVGAIAAVLRGAERDRLRWFAAAGAMFGLAVGLRLTWAPLGAALVGGCFINRRRATPKIAVLLAAAAFALLPLALIASRDIEATWFDYIGYPALNHKLQLLDQDDDLGLANKLIDLAGKVPGTPAGAVLTLLLAVTAVKALALRRAGNRDGFGAVLFTWAALLLTCAGAYAPAIIHRQYVYGPFAVAALAAGASVAYLVRHGDDARRAARRLGIAASVVAAVSLATYPHPSDTFGGDGSQARRVADIGRQIADLLPPDAAVATITPAFPLLAGLRTDPVFASGPFAWRTAHLIDAQTRREHRIVGPMDAASLLDADPPDGVLVGLESKEEALRDWAAAHGYKAHALRGAIRGRTAELWVRPPR